MAPFYRARVGSVASTKQLLRPGSHNGTRARERMNEPFGGAETAGMDAALISVRKGGQTTEITHIRT